MNKKHFVWIGALVILLLGLFGMFQFSGKNKPKAEPAQLSFKVKEIIVNGKTFNPKEKGEIPLKQSEELSISLVVQSLEERQPLKNAIASLSQNLKIGRAIVVENNAKNVKIKGLESTVSFRLVVPKDAQLGTALLSVGGSAKGKIAQLANIPCSIVANK